MNYVQNPSAASNDINVDVSAQQAQSMWGQWPKKPAQQPLPRPSQSWPIQPAQRPPPSAWMGYSSQNPQPPTE